MDWGVAQLWSKDAKEMFVRINAMIDRYRPALIVAEDVPFNGRRMRGWCRMKSLQDLGKRRGVPVECVTRAAVKRAFASVATTKQEVAVVLAEEFPELETILPRPRKPWMAEDRQMNVFDALAFMIAASRRDQPAAATA